MDYTCQAPLSRGLPRQEYWHELPFPSPGDLLDSGIEPMSPALAGRFLTTEPAGRPHIPSLLIGGWLLYSVVLVSATHQHEWDIGIHRPCLSLTSLPPRPHPCRSSQCWAELPAIQQGPTSCVLHMAVHICQYQSPNTPHHPTPAPCVPCPFSASAESTFFLCPFVCCEGPGRSMHCSHWRAVVKLPRPSLPRLQWINEKSR